MKPEHLLELADREVRPASSGQPRKTELKRAVSTAYYAVFHTLLWAIAETFVPRKLWKSRVLFYRALDHRKARDRCKKLGQKPLQREEAVFFRFEGFSDELRSFANHFVRLQELRHRCDYDPEFKISKGEAQQAIQDARTAISGLNRAAATDERSLFLAYLLFGIRSP